MKGHCACCGFTNIEVQKYPYSTFPTLCKLCATTSTSAYAEVGEEGGIILRTICYVGNAILQKLEEIKNG